jgi:hypothetical protein
MQHPPKFTQIWIFGLKTNHLATLVRSDRGAVVVLMPVVVIMPVVVLVPVVVLRPIVVLPGKKTSCHLCLYRLS